MRVTVIEQVTLTSNPQSNTIQLPTVDGATRIALYMGAVTGSTAWTSVSGAFPSLTASVAFIDPGSGNTFSYSGSPNSPGVTFQGGPSAAQAIEAQASFVEVSNLVSNTELLWAISQGAGTNGTVVTFTVVYSD